MTDFFTTMRALSLVTITCVAFTGCAAEPEPVGECDGIVCEPCAPALELRVRLESGAVPMNLTIDGADLVCSAPVGAQVTCTVDTLAIGTHALTVRVDDEAPVHLNVTVTADGGGCCSCGGLPVSRTLVVDDLSDAGA
jgi:hypothetical protein